MASRARSLFGPDLAAVRAKDLPRIAKTWQNDDDVDADASAKTRRVRGSAVKAALLAQAQNAATLAWLWEYSEWFDRRYAERWRCGRPREYHTMQALVVWVMTFAGHSEQQVIREIEYLWPMIYKAPEQAWPDHPHRRLPERPISKDQYYRFKNQHLTYKNDPSARTELHLRTLCEAQDAAQTINPNSGSWTNPSADWVLYGDESLMRPMHSRRREDAVNANGEIVHRYDPDAEWWHTNNADDTKDRRPGAALGHKAWLIAVRNNHVNERVILGIGVRDKNITEGDNIVNQLKQLLSICPQMRVSARAFADDRALQTTHIDDIYDLGLAPVVDTKLINHQIASFVIHDVEFKHTDGTIERRDVRFLHGTATIDFIDDRGELWHQPLRTKQVRRSRNKNGVHRFYKTVEVPDCDALGELVGATALIRIHTLPDEREPNTPRVTRAARAYDHTSPHHAPLSGRREDAESIFHHLKSQMPNRRCRSVGADRVGLNLLGYQALTNMRALIAYHHRTGDPLSDVFGQRPPTITRTCRPLDSS